MCLPRLCHCAALTGKSGGVLWSPIGEPQFIHVSSWLFQVQPLVLPTPPPAADLRGFPHSLLGDASKGVSLLPLRGKAGRDCSFWLSGCSRGSFQSLASQLLAVQRLNLPVRETCRGRFPKRLCLPSSSLKQNSVALGAMLGDLIRLMYLPNCSSLNIAR